IGAPIIPPTHQSPSGRSRRLGTSPRSFLAFGPIALLLEDLRLEGRRGGGREQSWRRKGRLMRARRLEVKETSASLPHRAAAKASDALCHFTLNTQQGEPILEMIRRFRVVISFERRKRALQVAVGLAACMPVIIGLWGVLSGFGAP